MEGYKKGQNNYNINILQRYKETRFPMPYHFHIILKKIIIRGPPKLF